METVFVGEVAVKEGVPQCPNCAVAMIFAGNEKHPSGNDMPIWRCEGCGNEFPPAAARAASIAAWQHARRRRQAITAIAAGFAILAAVAAIALL